MFKKIFASLLALTMVFGIGSQGAASILPEAAMTAEGAVFGDLEYEENDDGTIAITNYTGSGDAVIPAKIDGKTVTAIAPDAFRGNADLTSVEIPDSVVSIGAWAFQSCTSLKSVKIPDGVKSIGYCAFTNCSSLTSVEIPDSVTEFSGDIFRFTPWLDSKRKEDPLVVINGIVIDGRSCEGDVKIPEGVTGIVRSAFNDSSATSITLPSSLKSIGASAFSNCRSLTDLTVSGSAAGVSVPDGITEIERFTFLKCDKLTSLSLPDSITRIDDEAFAGCSGLTSIRLPSRLKELGQAVFVECSGLTRITIPDSVTKIDQATFVKCTGLTSITIPNSVTEIEYLAFAGCTGLTDVTISNSVAAVRNYAFVDCIALKNIMIPASVKEVEEGAFGYGYADGYEMIDDVHIYCYKGTAGETYAIENGFGYTLLDRHKGDVDLNGKVDSADVIKAAAYVKGTDTLNAPQRAGADVSGDGKVDSADVVKLAAYVKGTATLD